MRAKYLEDTCFLHANLKLLRSSGFVLILVLMPDSTCAVTSISKSPSPNSTPRSKNLRALAATGSDIGDEISRIEDKAAQALSDLYAI